jgi:hypothetical protein
VKRLLWPLCFTLFALLGAAALPLTILDLQPFLHTDSKATHSFSATLSNLNPNVNAWYLLKLKWTDSATELYFHLENPRPLTARLSLDDKFPAGIVIEEGTNRFLCDVFSAGPRSNPLESGRNSTQIYYPLCEGRILLRNHAKGQRSALEGATEFLRTQVWGGEKVIILFHHLLADRYRETAKASNRKDSSTAPAAQLGQPERAETDPSITSAVAWPEQLGIPLAALNSVLTPGDWYPAADNRGVYISILQADRIAPSVLNRNKNLVNPLDSIEAGSLCYLIAFDLDLFEVGYSRGTDYPGVGWSPRVLAKVKQSKLPGPDGISSIAPLVATGLLSPYLGRRTVATFTGGFKRSHGAFRYGDLSQINFGSHYGFIENGAVFSKLQPGLATLLIWNDSRLELKTWTQADNGYLNQVRHARQNGVPLVEWDSTTQHAVPSRFVSQWGPGNWSGSEDEKLRTIRGGLAIQERQGKRFFIYGVFSSATPSSMARIFQAYQCKYAMLLDMNALEHTYLAYYRKIGAEMKIDHLLKGMSQLDHAQAGRVIPRFLGYPDNRDFFYVMHRANHETTK